MADAPRDPIRTAAALRYRGGLSAPVVTAKGRGAVADAIVQRAQEHGVAIHVSNNLAAMLMQVEIDRAIPPQLFEAVAQLLAWLYQLEGRVPTPGRPDVTRAEVREPDTNFTLHHPADILAIVEQMLRDRSLMTVGFADGRAIVSSVLEVRREAHSLVFDIARDAEQNRHLFASPTLHFVTELDHVQVVFETRAASLVSMADGPAALVDLPEAVVRLQRREWFRAALPLQPPVRCTMIRANRPPVTCRTIDLSVGGTALLVADAAIDPSKPGAHHDLILSLPEVGPVELEATLRTVTTTPGPIAGAPKVRLGFRFEAVPAKTAHQIQRYVQRIEVEQLRILRLRD